MRLYRTAPVILRLCCADFQVGQASWPTPSGITEQQATAKCQQALQDSQLWSHCQGVPQVVDLNLIDCITDIMVNISKLQVSQVCC